jgi:hypothetical protein
MSPIYFRGDRPRFTIRLERAYMNRFCRGVSGFPLTVPSETISAAFSGVGPLDEGICFAIVEIPCVSE